MNPKDGSCKLFSIPLIGNHVTLEPTMSYRIMANEPADHLHLVSNAFDSDQKFELLKSVNQPITLWLLVKRRNQAKILSIF